MKTYAVINQKGGVGKTTTVANLGAAMASRGIRTCLIDFDPQAHLTLHLGVEPESLPVSAYEVLADGADLGSAVTQVARNLWLVPSVIDLAAAEIELVSKVGREQILRESMAAADMPFELVMIDCPPSLGLLTLNALAAADAVLIPLQPHFLALHGLGKLLETVSLVQQRVNPSLRVAGVVFCMYETGTRLAAEVAADLEQFLDSARGSRAPWADARIFTQRVRRNIKLAECPSHGKTIFDYDPASIGAEDYRALAEEFLAEAFPSRQPALGSYVPQCPPEADPQQATVHQPQARQADPPHEPAWQAVSPSGALPDAPGTDDNVQPRIGAVGAQEQP